MSTLREAAQQALEALGKMYTPRQPKAEDFDLALAAITALRAALAQQEPEPVGRFTRFNGEWKESPTGIPLYEHPPRREWQSLSEEEIDAVWEGAQVFNTHYDIARAVEAALKERNT
jgi:hypothetical protein